MEAAGVIFGFFVLIFSVVIHEYCHGLAAYHNGDDTAYLLGRLTLNPLAHLDPVGSVLLPIITSMTLHVPFGYAKPVPINPRRFRDYRKGMIVVGGAGCAANFTLGVIFSLLIRFSPNETARTVFFLAAYINFLLCFFNLIPVPPLDGSRILSMIVPPEIGRFFDRIERYGIIIVYAIIMFGGFGFISPICRFFVQNISGLARPMF